TDKAGSIRMDNNRSRTPGSRFRWKSEHQNAAPEQRPIHLPPMQLREAFSYISPFLFVVFSRDGNLLLRISPTVIECASPSINRNRMPTVSRLPQRSQMGAFRCARR